MLYFFQESAECQGQSSKRDEITDDHNSIVLNVLQDPGLQLVNGLVISSGVAGVDDTDNVGLVVALGREDITAVGLCGSLVLLVLLCQVEKRKRY